MPTYQKIYHIGLNKSYYDSSYSVHLTDNVDCLPCDLLQYEKRADYLTALSLAMQWGKESAALTKEPVCVYSDEYHDDLPYHVYNQRESSNLVMCAA
jgi:hypothetical protein